MNVSNSPDLLEQPSYRPDTFVQRTLLPLRRRLPSLDGETAAERRQAAVLYGGLLVLVAAILRYAGMETEPFWHDEITMLNIGLGGWDEFVRQFNAGRPPVFVFISFVWTALFGTGEVVSRLPSFLASVASIGVLFHLGSRIFNQRVGFLAALIMTVTEFHLYYAQTYRYYAVYVLLVLLSYVYFYALLNRRRWQEYALYVLFSALAFYTHTHGIFAIGSQIVFLMLMLVLKREWRSWRFLRSLFGVLIVLGLVIFPGFWRSFLADYFAANNLAANATAAIGGGEVGIGWLGEPTIGSIVRTLVRFLFFEWFYLNAYGILTGILFAAAGVAVYAARIGWRLWGSYVRQFPRDTIIGTSHSLSEQILVLTWFIGMIMFPWGLSFVVTPMFFDRYVLGASPAYYLLLALAAFGLRRIVPTRVTAIAFLVILLPGLFAFYAYQDNENWRGLTQYVHTSIQPNDAIVVLTTDVHLAQPIEAFNWYYPDNVTCQIYEDKLDDPATLSRLDECLSGHNRVWLAGLRWMGDYGGLANNGLSGNLAEFFATYDAGRWQLQEDPEHMSFFLLGLYLYEKRATEAVRSN